MDVFYYWKNHEADLKARRIGRFKSTPGKLRELVDGYPDFLWAFTTPKGRRGEVQLIARLRWSDRPTVKHKPEPGHVYLSYDPQDAQSVVFSEKETEAAIAATSGWVARNFPAMAAANFQGTAGQEALRGSALKELQELAAGFERQPFSSVATVSP
jgi:hypothetical protein